VPIYSVGRQYARVAAYTVLIITRALPRKPRGISILCALRTLWRSEIFWATLALDTSICIPSILPLGPHVGAQHPCMCPPLSYKREVTRCYKASSLRSNLDSHTQALKLNTAHSGVGYYAPAARTTLNPCVFLCSSRLHLTGKTLRPHLILGFRAGAFRHPAGEFPPRQNLIKLDKVRASSMIKKEVVPIDKN
jgi:hypothetical protein